MSPAKVDSTSPARRSATIRALQTQAILAGREWLSLRSLPSAMMHWTLAGGINPYMARTTPTTGPAMAKPGVSRVMGVGPYFGFPGTSE